MLEKIVRKLIKVCWKFQTKIRKILQRLVDECGENFMKSKWNFDEYLRKMIKKLLVKIG